MSERRHFTHARWRARAHCPCLVYHVPVSETLESNRASTPSARRKWRIGLKGKTDREERARLRERERERERLLKGNRSALVVEVSDATRAPCAATLWSEKKRGKKDSRSTFHRACSSSGIEGKTPKGTYAGTLDDDDNDNDDDDDDDDDDDPLLRESTRAYARRSKKPVLNDTKGGGRGKRERNFHPVVARLTRVDLTPARRE